MGWQVVLYTEHSCKEVLLNTLIQCQNLEYVAWMTWSKERSGLYLFSTSQPTWGSHILKIWMHANSVTSLKICNFIDIAIILINYYFKNSNSYSNKKSNLGYQRD